MLRPAWLGPDPAEEAQRKLAGEWEQMRIANEARAKREAAALAELWAGFSARDGVLLSTGASKEILSAYDDDGCIIQLDGVIEEITGERCRVRVLLESAMPGTPVIGMTLWVRRSDVSRTEGIHVWGQMSAKAHARKRRGGRWGESSYWAN